MYRPLAWTTYVLSIMLLLGLCALSLGISPPFRLVPGTQASADTALAMSASILSPHLPALLISTTSYTAYLPIIWAVQSPASSVFFPVGSGSTDVIPHQLVRTGDDRLYIFVSQENATTIRAYWTPTPGLPNAQTAFTGFTQATESGYPISLDAVYDGGNIIHVLINTNGTGLLRDHPFDLTTNSFKSALTLASDSQTVQGYYLGSSGVSGMVDKNGRLHVAYWSNGNHITHCAYTYNSSANTLALVNGPSRVDISGSANHPVVAVSSLDNSLTVAWVSEATSPAKILARTRTSAGNWDDIETVSTAPVWTSPNAGINIDQGPSLLIGPDGTKHLTYIENWVITEPYDYGRIHYAANPGTGWTDQALDAYSHDPALALNSSGQLYIIGHGYSLNQGCKDDNDMCTIKKNSNGTWGTPQLFAAHSASSSFDSSPSVKWSVVGFNRPQTIEFLFFSTPYDNPTVYYARLGG